MLDVEETATQAEIKAEYKSLALENHPDKCPSDLCATEDFQEVMFNDLQSGIEIDCHVQIQAAYEVLSDPDMRRDYDAALLAERQPSATSASLFTPKPPPTPAEIAFEKWWTRVLRGALDRSYTAEPYVGEVPANRREDYDAVMADFNRRTPAPPCKHEEGNYWPASPGLVVCGVCAVEREDGMVHCDRCRFKVCRDCMKNAGGHVVGE